MAYKRIVLATDGLASAESAEAVAASLAAATKGKLTVVHAYLDPARAEAAVARASASPNGRGSGPRRCSWPTSPRRPSSEPPTSAMPT